MGLMNSQYRKVAPASIDRRMATRHAVSVRRMMIGRPGEKLQDAQLGDLSKYGCRVITNENFGIGENILIGFTDAEPVSAAIIWREDAMLGCRFDHALAPQLFRHLTLLTD